MPATHAPPSGDGLLKDRPRHALVTLGEPEVDISSRKDDPQVQPGEAQGHRSADVWRCSPGSLQLATAGSHYGGADSPYLHPVWPRWRQRTRCNHAAATLPLHSAEVGRTDCNAGTPPRTDHEIAEGLDINRLIRTEESSPDAREGRPFARRTRKNNTSSGKKTRRT